MTTMTHKTWCTNHGGSWDDPDGYCRDRVTLHGVEVAICEQSENVGEPDDDIWLRGAPRIEVQSACDDDALTPEQARQLAALLMDKADVLERALADLEADWR